MQRDCMSTALENVCNSGMTSRTLKVITVAAMRQAIYNYHFLFVARCHNISIQQCFLNITTFTVYMIACDLEKSFTFDNKV